LPPSTSQNKTLPLLVGVTSCPPSGLKAAARPNVVSAAFAVNTTLPVLASRTFTSFQAGTASSAPPLPNVIRRSPRMWFAPWVNVLVRLSRSQIRTLSAVTTASDLPSGLNATS
jgi:hypothetical protein